MLMRISRQQIQPVQKILNCDCWNCKKIEELLLEQEFTPKQISGYVEPILDQYGNRSGMQSIEHERQSGDLLHLLWMNMDVIASNIRKHFPK